MPVRLLSVSVQIWLSNKKGSIKQIYPSKKNQNHLKKKQNGKETEEYESNKITDLETFSC